MSATPLGSAVDNRLYEQIAELVSPDAADRGVGDLRLRPTVEQALFHEARLLDERRYRDWLSRFTDDCIYWIPLDPAGDPRHQVSYLFDDLRRMHDRIGLLETGWAHAQQPPSRTCRTVSNVEAWTLPDGDVLTSCSTVTWEHRRDRMTPFVSHNCFVLASLGEQWSIRYKIVRLVNSRSDVPKFSFVL